MAAWHDHQLSNICSVWSPSPGSLRCDRTSGAEVINHYTHPWAAVWYLSSRTATESHTGDLAWFISRMGKGTIEVSITQVLQGKVPILNCVGRFLYRELSKTQTQPAGLGAKGFLSKYPSHCIRIMCWPACHTPVRMWTLWWEKERPIHLNPHFSTSVWYKRSSKTMLGKWTKEWVSEFWWIK